MLDAFAIYSRGFAHAAANIPCQDRAIAWTDGVSGVCAVADGHGSPIHMRSAIGARFAVDIAERCLRSSLALDPRKIVKHIPAKLLHEWRMACLSHYRRNPLVAKERKVAGEGGFDIAWYGTTLICAAMTPAFAAIIQIGDGEALAIRHDGKVLRPIPEDAELRGGVTKSLCDPAASREFRCRFLIWPASAQIRAIIPCTDGIVNSYEPKALDAFGKGVIDAIEADRNYALAQLADWLPELSRRGSADDMAMAGLVSERRFLIQADGFLPAVVPCNIARR